MTSLYSNESITPEDNKITTAYRSSGARFVPYLLLLVPIVTIPMFLRPVGIEKRMPGPEIGETLFEMQAIDTMKSSRDLARQKSNDASYTVEIDRQMNLIKRSGATHVAIDTPYDEEFIAYLKRWVKSARDHGLLVWFRGNFSGWEEWFGYPRMNANEHLSALEHFLTSNPDLFVTGDLFSPCPECENGGPGDPRSTSKRNEFNDFLEKEKNAAIQAFKTSGKDVKVVFSMNADVARTELASKNFVGGSQIVAIDHYVPKASDFVEDVKEISDKMKRNIAIGEFGAPVPDLHGDLSEADQASYIMALLRGLYEQEERTPLINYWTLTDGTTALVRENGGPKAVYSALKAFYAAPAVSGSVIDTSGTGIPHAVVKVSGTLYAREASDEGLYRIFLPSIFKEIVFSKEGYKSATVTIDSAERAMDKITLEKI